MLQVVIVLLGV